MLTKTIEATNHNQNWGKFLLGWFSNEEWNLNSVVDKRPLLMSRGWDKHHILVMDLQTGEGSLFRLGGYSKADMSKHSIWVCPLFEPFLEWLYKQSIESLADFEKLPALVQLPDAEFVMQGHRRPGPVGAYLQLEELRTWLAQGWTPTDEERKKLVASLEALSSGEWLNDEL